MDLSNSLFLGIYQFNESHEIDEKIYENGIEGSAFPNFETIGGNQLDDDLEDLQLYQDLENQLNFQNNNKDFINKLSYNFGNGTLSHFSYSFSLFDESNEKDSYYDYGFDFYNNEEKMSQIIEEDNNKIQSIKGELKPTMKLSKKNVDVKLKIKDKPNKSNEKFSYNSKNSTKSSSNSNNICLKQSMLNIKKARFKVLKNLKIPERFNEINLKLDMSCHNFYYEKKKDKIKKKIKKDYNIKDIKMENYEKPLIRQFKKFIKSNMVKYKGMLSQDKLFWDLFLGNKNEKYTQDEIMYKRKRFDKYNQKFLHYLFRRNDIKELYNNDFKAYCRLKNIKTTNDKIIYHFYSQYFDDLYKEEIPDIHFNIH